MSLSFRFPTRDESEARAQAAELGWAVSQEPVSVHAHGSDVQIEVHHPLAVLLSGTARLICCGLGPASRLLCPKQTEDCSPRGAQEA
jgi:hypothetical protein